MAADTELLLLSSKTPFVCMKTVSCQTIEKTNRLSLKKKSVQVLFQRKPIIMIINSIQSSSCFLFLFFFNDFSFCGVICDLL